MVAANPRFLRWRRRMLARAEWDGTYPVGRKRGVKVDTKARISDRCESVTKIMGLVPRSDWETLCKSDAELGKRDWVRYVLNQESVGSCAAEAADQCLAMRIFNDLNYEPPVFNPWFNYQKTSGGRDNGSVIGHNVEDLRDRGACPEEIRPRIRGWRAAPTAEELRIAKLFRLLSFYYVKDDSEFVSALLQGFAIHFGYTGHSIVAVLYLGSGKILYVNSWDVSWGDKGFGVLSLDKIRYDYGAYAYSVVQPWDRKIWVPKLNQAALAQAVNGFMRTMDSIHHPWADRQENVRVEAYRRSLQACGLAG